MEKKSEQVKPGVIRISDITVSVLHRCCAVFNLYLCKSRTSLRHAGILILIIYQILN